MVIVNAEKVAVTGRKETDKFYFRHTIGRPGGGKMEALRDLRQVSTGPLALQLAPEALPAWLSLAACWAVEPAVFGVAAGGWLCRRHCGSSRWQQAHPSPLTITCAAPAGAHSGEVREGHAAQGPHRQPAVQPPQGGLAFLSCKMGRLPAIEWGRQARAADRACLLGGTSSLSQPLRRLAIR